MLTTIIGILFVILAYGLLGWLAFYLFCQEREMLSISYLDYCKILFRVTIISFIETITKKKLFLCNPNNRPENHFKKGETIVLCNIRRTNYYGDAIGLIIPEEPEAILKGTVEQVYETDNQKVVKIRIGQQTYQLYASTSMLMHDWELDLIQINRIARWFYFLGLFKGEKNLKRMIPLRR